MFLPQVYKHSKGLFLVMISFVMVQLFINFKRGMVVSPFYHYGMYSEVMPVKPTYQVFEIVVNGKVLQGQRYSQQRWDKIIMPVQYFASLQAKSNRLYSDEIKRLMGRIGLNTDEGNFVSICNYTQFNAWYKQYLQSIVNTQVNDVQVHLRDYSFHQRLQPTSNITDLSALCQ